MAKPTSKQNQELWNRILRGMGNSMGRGGQYGNGAGALAAFMGIPNMAGNRHGWGGGGGFGGWGWGGGGGGGGGGGKDPGVPDTPDDPSDIGKLGGVKAFPQWYIDWYNSQGKYGGGGPQVPGLL